MAGETIVTPSSSLTTSLAAPRKQLWFHDGFWWVATDGYFAYRRDSLGNWTSAGEIGGQNSRRLDVTVDPATGHIYYYGWRSTTDDHTVGRALYDGGTNTYGNTWIYGNRFGDPALPNWGGDSLPSCALDSQGRLWVVGAGGGNIQYMVFDPGNASPILQGLTTITTYTTETQVRIVAFDDNVGPSIGVIFDDQTNNDMHFLVHRDSDALGSGWTEEDIDINHADDHGDVVATPSGEVLAVYKTELTGSSDINLLYKRRQTDGTWVDETTVTLRFGGNTTDEYTKPNIQYHPSTDTVYIISQSRADNFIYFWSSPRLSPSFTQDPVALDVAAMSNASTSALHLTDASSLLFVAEDGTTVYALYEDIPVSSTASVSINTASSLSAAAASSTKTASVSVSTASSISAATTSGGPVPASVSINTASSIKARVEPDPPIVLPFTFSDIIKSDYLEVEPIVEIYDHDLNFIQDISDDVTNVVVSHDNLATVAGKLDMSVQGEWSWESYRVKVSIKMSGLVNGMIQSDTTSLGIYIPLTPDRADRSRTPQLVQVEAFAPTYIYKTPRSNSYDVPEGGLYLTAVEALINEQGWPLYSIDPTKAIDGVPTDFVWLLEAKNTYLKIINDLLIGINYDTLYSSREGVLTAKPYVFPQDKGSTWTFTDSSIDSVILNQMEVSKDYAEVPNVWVFVRDDPTQAIPTEGDGIYIVRNQSDGPASIDAIGYERTLITPVDFTHCEDCLIATGDRIVSRSKFPVETVSLTSSPIPTIFHYDVVTLNTPTYGISNQRYFVESWQIDFSSGQQSFELQKIPLL